MCGSRCTCWKVRAMPSARSRATAARRFAGRGSCTLPAVGSSTPVIRLNIVLLPAPFGPISATISPARTSSDMSLTATRPPKCLRALVDLQQHLARGRHVALRERAAPPAGPTRALRATGSQRASAGHSPSRARCSSSTISTPNTMISKLPACPTICGRRSCSHCLEDREDRRADQRAPDVARAADHGHEQVLDAGVQRERRRVDEALHVRVQPARHAGEQRGETKTIMREAGVDAERLGHHHAAPQRADRAARARVEQVLRR